MATPTPEHFLQRAICARSSAERIRYAREGLDLQKAERSVRFLLLRQCYRAYWIEKKFEEALHIAEEMVELEEMNEVAHQDAARAAIAWGDVEKAEGHLRCALQAAPSERKGFHFWSLGSLFFLLQRYDEAIDVLEQAVRSSSGDLPLYAGHLALAQIAAGRDVGDLQERVDALMAAPSAKRYGSFILGHLAYAAGDHLVAKRFLNHFLRRLQAHPELQISLRAEQLMTEATLAKLETITRS